MYYMVDNYDSFVYNLSAYLEEAGRPVLVRRADEVSLSEIYALHPEGIILSPGPGRPEEAGVIIEAVKSLGDRIPILGVCLGHQAICAACGAAITYAKRLMHGKQYAVTLDPDCPLFRGCPSPALVARYHSLAADPDTLPSCLTVTARTEDGEVMAVRHRDYPIFGVQFHPESILTPEGRIMLTNFIHFDMGGPDYD